LAEEKALWRDLFENEPTWEFGFVSCCVAVIGKHHEKRRAFSRREPSTSGIATILGKTRGYMLYSLLRLESLTIQVAIVNPHGKRRQAKHLGQRLILLVGAFTHGKSQNGRWCFFQNDPH
jgi:hypothetical protein